GKRVLRLKGGDPCVFGRGGEEMLSLAQAGIPFRVVPGLTAGLAAMALALIPATMRGVNQAIVFVTGHCGDGGEEIDWAVLARLGQPIVLYMGMRTLGTVAAALIGGGLDPATPAAAIASAATPEQRIVVSPLAQLEEAVQQAGLHPPVITVIGGIVTMRARLRALIPVAAEHMAWLDEGC
ncbi:MAG: uroporphyrin-III methyltransferase, partial [Alphaproteobacteria bacterium]|nr:uroporphyrin-III methyltransferase [Alphaproteobacteria bacterium]